MREEFIRQIKRFAFCKPMIIMFVIVYPLTIWKAGTINFLSLSGAPIGFAVGILIASWYEAKSKIGNNCDKG